MPVRGLMYFGKLYDKYITDKKLNIYGSKLQKLPIPRFVVFYNGTDDAPPVNKLRLYDAFEVPDSERDFEWTAVMYNLNPGKNDDLLETCEPRKDYMTLVNKIREYQGSGMDPEKAIDAGVVYCIDNDIMAEMLLAHKSEVVDMCLTEYNEKVFIDGIKEEGKEDERRESLSSMLQRGKKPRETADFCDFFDLVENLQNNMTITVTIRDGSKE